MSLAETRNNRRHRPTDTVATPRDVFGPIDHEFTFTLDVCATADNAKCDRYFTLEDNGLNQCWAPNVCWCNPPYSDIAPWVAKSKEEAGGGRPLSVFCPCVLRWPGGMTMSGGSRN